MPRLLQLDSSVSSETSRTRQLTAAFAEAWRSRGPEFEVVVRDLHAEHLPQLRQVAQHWPPALRDEELDAETERIQNVIITELLAADAVVIGAPMYNYAMAATLKAWIDLIHVPSVTTAGPAGGPLQGKPVVVMTARGSAYGTHSPLEQVDPVELSLRLVLEVSLGMRFEIIATSQTLADKFPDFDASVAAAEFDAARTRARQLGSSV